MNDQVRQLEGQIQGLKEELAKARATVVPEPVEDFVFQTPEGEVRLSDLFGGKSELIVVHNMGRSCPYCTLWADGLSGLTRHFTQRAGFVVVSPDSPDEQARLKRDRGWQFTMVQDADRRFSTALGSYTEESGWWPGISGFHRDASGAIFRTGYTEFGPGDDFCGIWPALGLLSGGARGWEPSPA